MTTKIAKTKRKAVISVGSNALVRHRNRRNQFGVKDASECYRIIKGHEYTAWMSYPSAEKIKAYRAAGIRCRRFGVELFVHVWDTEEAAKLDAMPNLVLDRISANHK